MKRPARILMQKDSASRKEKIAMVKTSRYEFLFLIILFLSTIMACSYSSPAGSGNKTTSATVLVNVQTPPQSPSKVLKSFVGTIDDIDSITVDVLKGSTYLITGQALTYSGGVWSGTLENLPIGPSLTFVGHAYNASAVEIFSGTTVQAMTGNNDAVTILMLPFQDGVPAMFPKITRITVPSQIITSSTVTIGIMVEASSGEALTYATTAATGGGSFNPSSGTITLGGTTGTLVLSYSAPATAGTYSHSIRVTNSQTNWVETNFNTVVAGTATASLSVQFSPVITAIGAQRSGSNVNFTAVVSDATPTTLTYSWGFDGGLTFADNTTNPAVLQGYDDSKSGNLTLIVTNGAGGSTLVSYNIAPGLLPDNVTQYQLIVSEYVEGTANNKALEIWNSVSEPVDLQACAIRIYHNGSPTPGPAIVLSSILPAQETFVICHQSAGPELAAFCDAFSSSLDFNGNDAAELVCSNVTVDVFGQIGFDPGAGTVAENHTLRRMCAITGGDTNGFDSFDPLAEWSDYAVDTFGGLGVHGCP